MGVSIQLVLSEKLYLRDPEQTELGRRIVDFSIKLIDELGFEKFTFKKLATAISSTEASIYRYFENKHKLLLYLVAWYWSWLEYMIDYETHNIKDPKERLKLAIRVLANASTYDPQFSHIDEVALHRIVVSESPKAYLTKEVDGENEEGLFQQYKALVLRISGIILEFRPQYPYPKALVSTAIEASGRQIFFSQHLPILTEIKATDTNSEEIAKYLEHLIFTALG